MVSLENTWNLQRVRKSGIHGPKSVGSKTKLLPQAVRLPTMTARRDKLVRELPGPRITDAGSSQKILRSEFEFYITYILIFLGINFYLYPQISFSLKINKDEVW